MKLPRKTKKALKKILTKSMYSTWKSNEVRLLKVIKRENTTHKKVQGTPGLAIISFTLGVR